MSKWILGPIKSYLQQGHIGVIKFKHYIVLNHYSKTNLRISDSNRPYKTKINFKVIMNLSF